MFSKSFLVAGLVCSGIALILSSIAMISANSDGNVIKYLSWGNLHHQRDFNTYYGSYDTTYDVYVGVLGAYEDSQVNGMTNKETILYNGENCMIDVCNECQNTMPVVYGFLSIFVLLAMFNHGLNIARFWGINSCKTKSLSIVLSVLAIVVGLISLIVFASTCMAKMVKTLGMDTDYHYGAAFSLLATSVCLVFMGMIINALVDSDSSDESPAYQRPTVQQSVQVIERPADASEKFIQEA